MSSITAIIPAPVDIPDLPRRKVGELLVDLESATVFMVLLKDNGDGTEVKTAVPIKGGADYNFTQYLMYNNIISNQEPAQPGLATNWYNTDISYVPDTTNDGTINKKSAYLEIRVKDDSFPQGFKYLKILPVTEAKNVYLGGMSASGKAMTLKDLLGDNVDRLPVKPLYLSKDSKISGDTLPVFGELYIAADKKIYLKTEANDPTRDILVASSVDDATRSMIEDTIKIGQEQLLNPNENSLWLHESPTYNNNTVVDDSIMNASTLVMDIVNRSVYNNAGMRWVINTDNSTGVQLVNPGRLVTIHNNEVKKSNVVAYGYFVDKSISGASPVESDVYNYFELDFSDKSAALAIVLQAQGAQLTTGQTYGGNDPTAIPKGTLVVNVAGYMYNLLSVGDSYTTAKGNISDKINGWSPSEWGNHHLFFMMKKSAASNITKVAFGIVNNKGELEYVLGSNPADNPALSDWVSFTNLYNVAIAVTNAGTASDDTYTNVLIGRLEGKTATQDFHNGIPQNALLLNNNLANQNIYQKAVLATNAKSVFLDPNTTLATLFSGGRLITTIREYKDDASAKAGEILVKNTTDPKTGTTAHQLMYCVSDGNVVPLLNRHEAELLNHLQNSVRFTDSKAADLTVDSIDPSIVYYSTDATEPAVLYTYDGTNNVDTVAANPVIAIRTQGTGDKDSTGTTREYKYTVPRTLTSLITHNLNNNGVTTVNLETYLHAKEDQIKQLFKDEMYFDRMEQLGFNTADPVDPQWSTVESFGDFLTLLGRYSDGKGLQKDEAFRTHLQAGNPISSQAKLTDNGVLTVVKGGDNGPLYLDFYNDTNGKLYSMIASPDTSGTYTKVKWSDFKEIPLMTIDNNGKNTLSIDNLKSTVGNIDTFTSKTSSTVNTLVIKNFKDDQNDGLRSIQGLDPNISQDPFNVMNYTGSTTGPYKPTITIGDTPINNILLSSTSKPKWYNPTTSASTSIVVNSDLEDYFKYNGDLNTTAAITNLNNETGAGYYKYVHDGTTDLSHSNFPKATMARGVFILTVFNDTTKDVTTQILYHIKKPNSTDDTNIDTDIWTRSYIDGSFTPWVKSATEIELGDKANLGNTDATKNTTTEFKCPVTLIGSKNEIENTHLVGDVKVDSGFNLNVSNGTSTSSVLTSTIADNNNTLGLGNSDFTLNVTGKGDHLSYNNKNLANTDEVAAVSTDLHSNYYTSGDIDRKIANVGSTAANNLTSQLNNYISKNGTSTTNIVSGSIKLGTSDNGFELIGGNTPSIKLSDNTVIKLPNAGNDVKLGSYTGNTNIAKYGNIIRYDSLNDTNSPSILTVGMDTDYKKSTSSPTSIQFKQTKKSGTNTSTYEIRNIYGAAVGGDWSTLLTSDNVTSDFSTNDSNMAASSELTNRLYNDSLTKLNKNDGINKSQTAITNIKGLATGQYQINDPEQLKALGLDSTVYPVPVMLTVGVKQNGYKLVTVKSLGDVSKTASMVVQDSSVTGSWIHDDANYDKADIQGKIDHLTEKLSEFTESMDYLQGEDDNIGANRMVGRFYRAVETKKVTWTSEIFTFDASQDFNFVVTIKGVGTSHNHDYEYDYHIDDSDNPMTFSLDATGLIDKVQTFLNDGGTIQPKGFMYYRSVPGLGNYRVLLNLHNFASSTDHASDNSTNQQYVLTIQLDAAEDDGFNRPNRQGLFTKVLGSIFVQTYGPTVKDIKLTGTVSYE